MEKRVFPVMEKKELETLRQKMVEAAELHGLEHPLVLHYSKKVDQEHNRMLRMNTKSFPSVNSLSQRKYQII
ncbi:Spo0E family sporulation regulatory protein-aspartic acid phosphatase [Alteribacillus bidgolensis]|uniref:Spo0E like sporulation regulatory protein n=1 Tax=Alteribacillus bidgolensis TaxID=930129 RepID=A0A1G8EJI6_9BACI|nr:Spo0E family sporulation regulatory protein-aspartic acid phosphatase [Alteribacillus bidgolensis]SDH70094.1 Spo0E like sporulation regulatory protein [Alteribacillus bidgolensis]